jgi:hypothetical protein
MWRLVGAPVYPWRFIVKYHKSGRLLAVAQHFVRVVEDGSLATPDGWAIARCEEDQSLYFVVERSAATNEETLSAAWAAARTLVIEQAVEDGEVEWVRQRVRT